MSRSSRFRVALPLFLLAGVVIGTQPNRFTVHGQIASQQRQLFLSVTDRAGQPYPGLASQDLKISENGTPQRLLDLKSVENQPVSVLILLDASWSQEKTLRLEIIAAKQFVKAAIRENDQAAVASFNLNLKLEQTLTSDSMLVRNVLEGIHIVPRPSDAEARAVFEQTLKVGKPLPPSLGATALWDSVALAAKELLSQSPPSSRRVIVVLTDGSDTSSQNSLDAVVDALISLRTTVYSFCIADPHGYNRDESSLRKVSERTGGVNFTPKDQSQLDRELATLQAMLHSGYLVTYERFVTEKRKRKLGVEIINPNLKSLKLQFGYPRFTLDQ